MLESLDNRILATDCYKQALHCDVYCYEAFDVLIKHHMLSAVEGIIAMLCELFSNFAFFRVGLVEFTADLAAVCQRGCRSAAASLQEQVQEVPLSCVC